MKINSFSGDFEFLSNFYLCEISYEGIVYPSVEHAYQAAKTLDKKARKEISKLSTPGKAKRVGMKVSLRANWDSIRISVMRDLLFVKFRSHPELKLLLLETDSMELIEGNNWGDKFWGQVDGKGKNWLGKLLMEVRAMLGAEELK